MSPEAHTEAPRRPGPEAVADFLKRMRLEIEDGLDPRTAAQRAAACPELALQQSWRADRHRHVTEALRTTSDDVGLSYSIWRRSAQSAPICMHGHCSTMR